MMDTPPIQNNSCCISCCIVFKDVSFLIYLCDK
nr:MAG TPA: hypothetical protein [Caudoviricetes sp.]